VVLETQPPEEDVIAAARLYFNDDERCGCVDIFCAAGDSEATILERLAYLLFKLESVVFAHNYVALTVEVTQWQEDIQGWLIDAGYEDRGGYVWPSEKASQLLKPTMIFRFKKDLRIQSEAAVAIAATSSESEEPDESSLEDLLSHIAANVDSTEPASFNGALSGSSESNDMEHLFSQLFKALHSEYPQEEAQPKEGK
jgi:hypothetical protein